MKQIRGGFLADLAVYGLGDFLARAANFLVIPLYTRVFTPDEYGVWNVVGTLAGLLAAVVALGMDTAYARLFFDNQDRQFRRVLTSTAFWFLLVWGAIAALTMLWLAPWMTQLALGNTAYVLLVQLALVAIPLNLLGSLCGQVLRNDFKAGLFTGLNMAATFLTIGLGVIAVLVLDMGLAGLFWGALLSGLLLLPLRLWFVRSMLILRFDRGLLRALLQVGVPLVPVSLAYWVFTASDRVVIAQFASLEQNGFYALASQITAVLGLAMGALGQAWSPYAFHLYQTQPQQAQGLFGKAVLLFVSAMALVAATLGLFAHELVLLLSIPAFLGAMWAVGPLALAFVANASTQVTALPFSLTKQTHYLAWLSWGAALLNLGLNLWFVPVYGMVAAAWSTAFSYMALSLAYAWFGQKLWAIRYPVPQLLCVVLMAMVAVVLGGWWGGGGLWTWLARLLLLMAMAGIIWRLGVVDRVLLAGLIRPKG